MDAVLPELIVSACELVWLGSVVDIGRGFGASFYSFSKTMFVGQTKASNAQ